MVHSALLHDGSYKIVMKPQAADTAGVMNGLRTAACSGRESAAMAQGRCTGAALGGGPCFCCHLASAAASRPLMASFSAACLSASARSSSLIHATGMLTSQGADSIGCRRARDIPGVRAREGVALEGGQLLGAPVQAQPQPLLGLGLVHGLLLPLLLQQHRGLEIRL